jgi:hypothetical protein
MQLAVQTPEKDSTHLLSTVFFNDALAGWMKENHVAEAGVLQKADAAGYDTFEPTPPKTSVAVKEIWEAFNLIQSDDPWRIQVYDPDTVRPTNGALPAVQSWDSYLTIKRIKTGDMYDLDTSTACKDEDYPVESGGTNVGAQVPANCFYYKPSNGPCSSLIPSTSIVVGLPPDAKTPCVVILVGLQIATREVENWTWTAFWWTNKMKTDGTEDRDAGLPPQFRHYAMKTMVSPDQIPTAPGSLPALFNPYLEGPSANGVYSNCLLCHAHASYKPSCEIGTPGCPTNRNGFIPSPGSPRDASPGSIPNCYQKSDRVRNHCPIRTNFIWSIATNQEAIPEPIKR